MRALAYSDELGLLASGGTDGALRLWRLSGTGLVSLQELPEAHSQHKFFRPLSGAGSFQTPLTTHGVMCVRWEGDQLASSGSDGRVVVRSWRPVIYNAVDGTRDEGAI